LSARSHAARGICAFVGTLLACIGSAAAAIAPAGSAASSAAAGQPAPGGILVAQFLGDALTCAFTPYDDICIANQMQSILGTAPRGDADGAWAFWYQTIIAARGELLFVPRPIDIFDNIEEDDFAGAVAAIRAAYENDEVGAFAFVERI